MNLIYNVDLVPSLCRRVIDLFTDLTDIIHTIIRCSVDLVFESRYNVLLPFDILKFIWAELSV